MAFGFKTVGNAINPSAVGVQNKKPQVYGLAKLSALDPVTCTEQLTHTVDWYTAAFAAGGAVAGLLTEDFYLASTGAVVATFARNYFTRENECQSVPNALGDVLFAIAGYGLVRWLKDRK